VTTCRREIGTSSPVRDSALLFRFSRTWKVPKVESDTMSPATVAEQIPSRTISTSSANSVRDNPILRKIGSARSDLVPVFVSITSSAKCHSWRIVAAPKPRRRLATASLVSVQITHRCCRGRVRVKTRIRDEAWHQEACDLLVDTRSYPANCREIIVKMMAGPLSRAIRMNADMRYLVSKLEACFLVILGIL
jgi:hypothetical protein